MRSVAKDVNSLANVFSRSSQVYTICPTQRKFTGWSLYDHRALHLPSKHRGHCCAGRTSSRAPRLPCAPLEEYDFNVVLVANAHKRDIGSIREPPICLGQCCADAPVVGKRIHENRTL